MAAPELMGLLSRESFLQIVALIKFSKGSITCPVSFNENALVSNDHEPGQH